MPAQSIKKAKKLRVVTTLEMKLKITGDFEAGKQAVNIGRELVILPTATRTIVARKNIIRFPRRMIHSILCTLSFFSNIIKILINIFVKCNYLHRCIRLCIKCV
jgi:hypothetical protein